MLGASSPGTPARYDKVGVIKVGRPSARNVLVLEPGTSAGAAYFVPLAKWIVARAPGWQVWSVERRENLLEDQSVLTLAKQGLATSTQLFDYYLGWLDPALQVQTHIQLIPNATVGFAKQWGMRVAVEDLHHVIAAARRLGGHGRARRPLARRRGRDRVRHLGLPRPPGRRRPRRSRLHRRRQLPGGQRRQGAVRAPRARIRRGALRGSRSAASRRRSPGCSA